MVQRVYEYFLSRASKYIFSKSSDQKLYKLFSKYSRDSREPQREMAMPMVIGGCQSIFDAGIDQRRCRRWRERAEKPFVSFSSFSMLLQTINRQKKDKEKHNPDLNTREAFREPIWTIFYVFSSCIVGRHFFHHFAHQQIWNIDISIKTSCCNSADSRL